MGNAVQYFTYRADVPASAFLKRVLEGENISLTGYRRPKSSRVSVATAAPERMPEAYHEHRSPDWQSVRRSVWVGPPSLRREIGKSPELYLLG